MIRDAPLFEWLEANMGRLLARDPEVRRAALCCAVLRSSMLCCPLAAPGCMAATALCYSNAAAARPTVAAARLPLDSTVPPTACWLCMPPPLQAFTYAIERSCINKAEVVAADEKEGGVRATLNLGHTFGHAIETCTGAAPHCRALLVPPRPAHGRHGRACARVRWHCCVSMLRGVCRVGHGSPTHPTQLPRGRVRRVAARRGGGCRHDDGSRHVAAAGLD